MNPIAVLGERAENITSRKSVTTIRRPSNRPTLLIATIDLEIREALAELLEGAAINAIWVNGVKDVKMVVARETIVACLCGFWLQDGTYREVIRHLRRERQDVPAIIVASPACPQNFREYLAALNLEELDFLTYPYQSSDLKKILESATAAQSDSKQDFIRIGSSELSERGAA